MAARRIKPISKADLARLLGTTRQYVNKLVHGPLAVAVLEDGSVDSEHPAVLEFRRSKTDRESTGAAKCENTAPRVPTSRAEPRQFVPPAPTEREPAEPLEVLLPDDGTPESMAAFMVMRFGDVVQKFGTDHRLLKWVDALKKIEDTRKTRLDNDETEGKLILREGVRIHIGGAIEAFSRRLLRDIPRTLASRMMSSVKSGATLEECEALIRDSISSQLRQVQATATRILRGDNEP